MAETLKTHLETRNQQAETQKKNLEYLNSLKEYLLKNDIRKKSNPNKESQKKAQERDLNIKDFDGKSLIVSSYGHTSKFDLPTGVISISGSFVSYSDKFIIRYNNKGTIINDENNKTNIVKAMRLADLVHEIIYDHITKEGKIIGLSSDGFWHSLELNNNYYKYGKTDIKTHSNINPFDSNKNKMVITKEALEEYGIDSETLIKFLNSNFGYFGNYKKGEYEKKQQLKKLRQETQNNKK